jgi:CheY-like chemotaxis protein
VEPCLGCGTRESRLLPETSASKRVSIIRQDPGVGEAPLKEAPAARSVRSARTPPQINHGRRPLANLVDIFPPAIVIANGRRNVEPFRPCAASGGGQLATKTGAPARILLVDDEELVRSLAVEILSSSGYDVVSAVDGDSALLALRRDNSISLLITDIKMPGALDGWALARHAKAMRPELRVIYMTGYYTLPPEDRGAGYGPVLPKPWRAQELIECVCQAI